MKRIKISLVALLLLLTALWLGADTLVPTPFTYFSFRTVFVQYSGVLGIGLMSIAMLLALRPTWLEPHLDGLDKMYRLHKWLGISALVVSVLHWWWAKGTKWMVGWGWLEKPARKPNADETLGAIEGWLRSQPSIAPSVSSAFGLRAGFSSQPQPTIHLVPFAHHQCSTETTRALMPSHLCRRYILSRPSRCGSSHVGRSASSMAILIRPMPSTPLYCTNTVRNEK